MKAKIDYAVWGGSTVTNYNVYDGSQDVSYTGKDRDATGLYYFNARYYDAVAGRFYSEDPIRDGGNWFVYCGNNPLSFTDPTGLDSSFITTLFYERIWGFDIGFYSTRNLDGGGVDAGIYAGRVTGQPTSSGEVGNGLGSIGTESHEGSINDIGLVGSAYSDKYKKTTDQIIFVDPAKMIDKTPLEIGEYALSLGLQPRGPDPNNGTGSYVDPSDGRTQRVLISPEGHSFYPIAHAHANDPRGERLDVRGNTIPEDCEAAHIPINHFLFLN